MSNASHVSAALMRSIPQRQTQTPEAEVQIDVASGDTPEEQVIKRLFMLMHGRYGKAWLEKWVTGDLDERGRDRGVLSAMRVWRIELSAFGGEVLRAAADAWKSSPQGKWPPSLPEFEALCIDAKRRSDAASAFRAAAKPPAHKDFIEASPEAIAAHRAAVRELATARMRAAMSERNGDVVVRDGLPGLIDLVARAAALAGADEARTLRKLETRVFGVRAA